MTALLTAAQMRTIERLAISAGEQSGSMLMERAGRGVTEAIFSKWPNLGKEPQYALVLCGPGNNGGDGFVVARYLRQQNWSVQVLFYGDPEALPADARANYDLWRALGPVGNLTDGPGNHAKPGPNWPGGVVVDAMFGTGLNRALGAGLKACLVGYREIARQNNLHWVAVDVPSGMCSDSGKILESADGSCPVAVADLCVTFHQPKVGHYLGSPLIDDLVVRDIGLNNGADPSLAFLTECPAPVIDKGTAGPDGHKYAHGHALVLSGGPGRTGAARLAARAALRIGAGLVTLGVPPAAMPEVAGQITAIMQQPVQDAADLDELLKDRRFNTVCLGPGLGQNKAHDLVFSALNASHRPSVVLDADALSAFREDPKVLFTALHEGCVLTPHGGEFARLFPDIAASLTAKPRTGPAYSKIDAVRDAAARAGCVVLLKGADTVIADPAGQCSVHAAYYDRKVPWLATAGAGDVLAGFIAGLLGRGLSPKVASESAAWLHVECARHFGPGLIAEDLPDVLPKVLRGLFKRPGG